jgi:hypothetical protein
MTGKSQIERLTSCQHIILIRDGLPMPSAQLIVLLAMSIEYSRKLSTEIEEEDLVKKIISRNSLADPKILKSALHRIYEIKKLKRKIDALREKQFCGTNMADIAILSGLWKSLKGTEAPGIPDGRWGDVGFQGTDPSTDFRGMGFLGLHQLAELSRLDCLTASKIFAVASEESTTWFPYAVTGINVTAFQYQLLKSNRLDQLLYGSVANVELKYANVYAEIFSEFLKQWIAANPTDIMDFPRVFSQVKATYVKSLNY